MIKAIFVAVNKLDGIEKSHANYLMVSEHGIKAENWKKLNELGMKLTISVDVCQDCPANPKTLEDSVDRVRSVLEYKPDCIWLDHLRFDGRWERETQSLLNPHRSCRWCTGKDRAAILVNFARKLSKTVRNRSKLGYFAVPFKKEERPDLVEILGQDHHVLASSFDIISPMLYHRMIGKEVGYISEYVSYLSKLTAKPILPIIQITNMPDLETTLPETEIVEAYLHAKNLPSEGVALFWWTNAMLIDKTQVVHKLFSL